MFGLEPKIDLLKIKDNMANCDKGYSFVTDPRNELTSAYLDLLRRACTARSRCLSRGNSWNWAEVNQYMKKEDFRELLGTGMSLTGGQLPRWPELSSLWVENDELGPRGLYVYKGYIIYVVRHHKAKSSTNREFVVVRFLPAELALAVFKYCTYIHPFINLLDRERGIVSPSEAGQSSSPLLFRTQTVPSNSNVWRTSRFTSVIRKVTTEAWGFVVNSRLLRQICIGITEKHVREVYRPFNRFDDRSKDAHRNVVFAWQSGHRPLQRGSTYGLDGAFPTTMQPQLLDLYEWASVRWHEFLHLPSKLRPRMNAQVHSDRERILGHQPRLTSRGAEEVPTAEMPVSEIQVTPGQRRDRDRVISTPVAASSLSISPGRTPALEATENTPGRSLAEPSVPLSSSHSRSRWAIQQRQPRSSSQDPPDDENRQSEREARERAERAEYLSMIHQDDTEAFERESRRQHQEQTAQEEIRHHHNRSTKRSNYQLHRSKDTTPPPKRRRTLPLSFTSQDVRDQSLNDDNWSHRPLFRYPGDIATSGAMVTRMAVLDHLGTRIGFSDDKNLLRANLKLWTLGEQLEKWCSVGCQLCYVCGDMGLDHKLDDYTTAGSEVARRLLGWLETLHLDRFVGARGNCSLCTETNQICEDIAIGLWVCDASTEEETNRWKRKYMSATDPDGLCGNKPAIRRAIAALCAFDEQLLGKTLTTFISRKNDVDLTIESHAVEWFERKVPHGETWVPQLLIVFDVLVAAFKQYLRRPYQEDQRAAQDRSVSSGPREEQPILAARRIQR
ncbi:hypothetical protein V3481_018826 [Fusarium oxysporum f. sp. vasinfectum]|uniref:Uncharacterized protein n=1 Tax=Fusarium oxysporum f. sp. vasinfectum 25433 TaxID=1089449 RepID=X0KPQ2_FUSOX|nr:hypothetical protein FOTG_16085 [Fusarium oxysporum f. sp. vasinfectum 25433]